jgi:hypothetical protein
LCKNDDLSLEKGSSNVFSGYPYTFRRGEEGKAAAAALPLFDRCARIYL